MADIRIEWLFDTSDCDTCGMTWAEGAKVYFDGKLRLDLQPVAYCCGCDSWSTDEVYALILKEFGHTVSEDH